LHGTVILAGTCQAQSIPQQPHAIKALSVQPYLITLARVMTMLVHMQTRVSR
jgi:hypothetical protein